MRKNKKSLKEEIREIEVKNQPPGLRKTVRDLRKQDYNRSDEAEFKRFKKKQKKGKFFYSF